MKCVGGEAIRSGLIDSELYSPAPDRIALSDCLFFSFLIPLYTVLLPTCRITSTVWNCSIYTISVYCNSFLGGRGSVIAIRFYRFHACCAIRVSSQHIFFKREKIVKTPPNCFLRIPFSFSFLALFAFLPSSLKQ